MPTANIDGINVRYSKEKHLANHCDVAFQVRGWIHQKTFTIWNEGADHDYAYTVQNLNGAWRIHTRQVWITDKVFKNVVDRVEDLLVRDQPTRRVFS
tara:strand:+ start:227 stop:517 length:291 start_codon:yes stop_codon:yes gene_type:complete